MSCKTVVLEGVATGTTAVVTSLAETHGVIRGIFVDAKDLSAGADVTLGWIHPDVDSDLTNTLVTVWVGTNVGTTAFTAYPHGDAVDSANAAMLFAGAGEAVPAPAAVFGKLRLSIAQCVAGEKFRVLVLVD